MEAVDARTELEEKQREAFLSIMTEGLSSSPSSKMQDDIDDRLYIMESLLRRVIAEEGLCKGVRELRLSSPSPVVKGSPGLIEDAAPEAVHEEIGKEADLMIAQEEIGEDAAPDTVQEEIVKKYASENNQEKIDEEADIVIVQEEIIEYAASKNIKQEVGDGDESIIILEHVDEKKTEKEQPSLALPEPPLFTPFKKSIIKPTLIVHSDIKVASLQPPQQKIFHKTQPLSNKARMLNALQYAVFPGPINSDKLAKARKEITSSTSKHFVVLFRDQRFQFRALYSWDQKSSEVHKISGVGPAKCTPEMLKALYKYNSGAKRFDAVPAKDFANIIDGFTIDDSFWTKPKPAQGPVPISSSN